MDSLDKMEFIMCLNPCYNGIVMYRFGYDGFFYQRVLILVIME